MYYLFSDDEVQGVIIEARTFRGALLIARDRFQIKGRLIKTYDYIFTRFYKLSNSAYGFSLKQLLK